MASSPTFDPNARRPRPPAAFSTARRAAPQPRHAGALPAGLDVQGRDGGDRARPRQVDARTRLPRALLHRHDRARRCATPRGEAPGPHDFRFGARALHQHHVRPGRQGAGEADARRGMERFGFGSKIPMAYPSDQIATSGLYRRAGACSPPATADRRRAHRDRPGAPARDAAADVHGGGLGGERRQARRAAAGEGCARPDGTVVERPAPHVLGQAMTPSDGRHPVRLHDPGRRRRHGHRGDRSRASRWPARRAPRETGRGTLYDAWFIAFAPVS